MKDFKISLFKGYSDTQPVASSLQEVVNLIRCDASIRDHTEKHRYYLAQNQKSAAAHEKAGCPCFSVAVCFAGGKQRGNICGWTKLCLADIDDVASDKLPLFMKQIQADPHTLLAYVTISGAGIRILFLLDCLTDHHEKNLKLYSKAFEQTNRYYAQLLGCECDMKCKNATRLSGLAHDPNLFFNPDATPFHLDGTVAAQENQKSLRNKRLLKAIEVASQELEASGVMYQEHSRNEYIMRMGYLLNAYGVAQKLAIEWALHEFTDYDGDVAAIFTSCYQHTDEHGTRSFYKRKQSISSAETNCADVAEIEAFLETQARFRQNVITGKCEASSLDAAEENLYVEIDDRYVNTLWCRMSKEVKMVHLNDIRNILSSEFTPLYNPFTHFFEQLEPWDGKTDYLEELANTVHVSSEQAMFNTYFRKWFVGMIVSLLDNRVVNHEILVLIGPQGTYKTTWLNNLLPDVLQRYFYTKANNNRINKDDMLSLTEFALICLEEIDELSTSELNQLKAMTTMKIVNERMAYAHYKECRPHIASFCGTSNSVHFLSDPTGNRRWLPFEVKCIDNPYTHPVNYQGVYAQAYALWQSGFRYWFDDEEIVFVNLHNQHFEVPRMEHELISIHYRRPIPGENCIFVTTAQILGRISGSVKQLLSPTKIGVAMKQLGFELVRIAGRRGYRVVELTSEEIYRNQCAMARYTEGLQESV